MSASPFLDRLSEKRPLMLDGAMGTMLQAAGLPLGVSPEEFCMQRPDILQDIHAAYVEVGADIITACTFGGNPYKRPAVRAGSSWPATWGRPDISPVRWAMWSLPT